MNEMFQETRSTGPSMAAPLFLPLQGTPVDRTPTGVALAAGAGVEAAGWWDIAKHVASGLGSIGDKVFG